MTLIGHTDTVTSAAFSPDGKRIVSGSSDETVRIWDASTGQPVGSPLEGRTDYVRSVAFSPDGKRIVSESYNTVQIQDAATSQSHIVVFLNPSCPFVLIAQIAYIQEPSSHYQSTLLLSADGWLQQMCWLPPDKQSSEYRFDWTSHTFAVFDDQHALVLLQIT